MNITLRLKWLANNLGKISTLLIVLTVLSWLFNLNAGNCLSRDFVTKATPAYCWRTYNDYESTILYSSYVFLALLAAAIVSGSITLTRHFISNSQIRSEGQKKIKSSLILTSLILFVIILVIIIASYRVPYDNNTYLLNTATNLAVDIGIPLLLATTASAVVFMRTKYRKM